MDLGLRGKTAIVCGASSGLGLAVAEALVDEGANVAMFARRRDSSSSTRTVWARSAVRGDVTNARRSRATRRAHVQAFGGVDVLVCNSGGPPAGQPSQIGDDDLEAAFELLLLPTVRLVRLSSPTSNRAQPGRIVCITSAAVRSPPTTSSSRTPSAPVSPVGRSRSPASSAPDGITVNCVAPADRHRRVSTELYGRAAPRARPEHPAPPAGTRASSATSSASSRPIAPRYVTGAALPSTAELRSGCCETAEAHVPAVLLAVGLRVLAVVAGTRDRPLARLHLPARPRRTRRPARGGPGRPGAPDDAAASTSSTSIVRKATLLERSSAACIRCPISTRRRRWSRPGVNDRARRGSICRDMHRSQEIAAAVHSRPPG